MKISKEGYKDLISKETPLSIHLGGMYHLILSMAEDFEKVFDTEKLSVVGIAEIHAAQRERAELIEIIKGIQEAHEEIYGDLSDAIDKDLKSNNVNGCVLGDVESVDKAKENGYNPMVKNLVPPTDLDIKVLLSDLSVVDAVFMKLDNGDQGFSIKVEDVKGKENAEIIGWKLA